MAVKKGTAMVSFIVAIFLVIVMFAYASIYGDSYSNNFARIPMISGPLLDNIDTVDEVAEDENTFRSDIYARNKKPTTVFNAKLIYETTKGIHNVLYSGPTNQTCEKQFPTCILLGVYKCGTRELMDFVSIHPNIQIKRHPYEFGYFMDRNYKSGDERSFDWFRKQLPCIYDDQISMMKHAGYFANPQVPERIHKFNKNIKMVLMVREPVQRFISHVWFYYKTRSLSEITNMIESTLNMKTDVRATLGENTFSIENTRNTSAVGSEALMQNRKKTEPRKIVRNPVLRRLLEYSIYDESFARFMKYFRRDQLLVIESEEFKQNPASVINKIEQFLHLPRQIHKDMFVYNAQKKYYCVKSLTGDQVCYSDIRGRDYKKEINNATKQKLKNYFRPHNERFFSLIGKRFDHWGY